LSWVENLSICSLTYIASAVPTLLAALLQLRQVIDKEMKMAFAGSSVRSS
jgi:hypothetical protein